MELKEEYYTWHVGCFYVCDTKYKISRYFEVQVYIFVSISNANVNSYWITSDVFLEWRSEWDSKSNRIHIGMVSQLLLYV